MVIKKEDTRKTLQEQLEQIKSLVRPHIEEAPKKRKSKKQPTQ